MTDREPCERLSVYQDAQTDLSEWEAGDE